MRIQRTLPSVASSASSLVLVGLIGKPLLFLLFPLSIALFHMASSVVNDLSDYHVDKVNAPERALPSGKISQTHIQILFLLLFGGGLFTAFLLDYIYFLVVSIFGFIYIFSYNYGPSFKNHPLGSFMYYTLSGSVAPYVMTSLIARNFGFDDLTFTFLLAILATCAVTGSMSDYEGDIMVGKRTFPVVLGFNRARLILAAMVLNAVAVYPILYYVFNFSSTFLILLIFPLSFRIALFYSVLHYKNPGNFHRLGPLYRTIIAADMVILALTLEGGGLMFR